MPPSLSWLGRTRDAITYLHEAEGMCDSSDLRCPRLGNETSRQCGLLASTETSAADPKKKHSTDKQLSVECFCDK